jgi:undecaprenyl-diphosphatase
MLDVTGLAILQGIAEFLPISSSGHLAIAQNIFHIKDPGARYNVFLHFGTLLAVVLYYRSVVWNLLKGLYTGESRMYVCKLLLSTIPAVVVYFIFKSQLEAISSSLKIMGAFLIFTGIVLVSTRFFPKGEEKVSFGKAFLMGVGQALALMPGISRSGMTISTARAFHVEPKKAAEFSFLMSVPLIFGGSVLELIATFGKEAQDVNWGIILYGVVLSAVVGYFSLAILVKMLKSRSFWLFGFYCMIVGFLLVLFR